MKLLRIIYWIFFFIILFEFGLIVVYWGHPIFADIIKFISLPIMGLAIWKYKEHKKQCLNHSKILLDNNIRFRTNTHIYFEGDNTLNLKIKTDEWGDPSKADERYSKEVDAHLESGYFKELWEPGTERDKFIIEHNALAKDFLRNLTERVISEIKQKNPALTEKNKSGAQIKYFLPQYISYSISNIVQGYYDRINDLDEYYAIKQENNRWMLINEYLLAESEDKSEIIEIKQVITSVLNEALTGKDFKMLKKYRNDIKEKHYHYVKGSDERKMEVENGRPLKGRCKLCPKYLSL